MKTAILLYEPKQVDLLDALFAQAGGLTHDMQVVSLDAEIDYLLEKKGINFFSGKKFIPVSSISHYTYSEVLTDQLCESSELSFLQYRNISLLEPLRSSIQVYFWSLLYYIDLIGNFCEQEGTFEKLLVPAPVFLAPQVGSPLASEETRVVVESARLVAKRKGVHVEIFENVPIPFRFTNHLYNTWFRFKRAFFGILLTLINSAIKLRSRRPVRILASDYWRYIAPTMQSLPDAELILLDRVEAFDAGIANIWKHKVRFMHVQSFLSRSAKQQVLTKAETYMQQWKLIEEKAWQPIDYVYKGILLRDICKNIITSLVSHTIPQLMCDIEATYKMYEIHAPNAVLLRASVSRQTHFAILPLVARQMGIPSLEVQHGVEYLGPGSLTKHHAVEYIATYGKLVADEFISLGYSHEKLLLTGSPRFDEYVYGTEKAPTKKETSNFIIVTNTPTSTISERYGTYSIEDYFKALSNATKNIKNARILIGSRPDPSRVDFNAEALARGLKNTDHAVMGATPLPKLFVQSDVVVCTFSTIVYEALLYKMPVVIAALTPVEKMMSEFHFGHFRDTGALLIATTEEELAGILQKLSTNREAQEQMGIKGYEFMKQNFSFDGKASERIADFIRQYSGPKV